MKKCKSCNQEKEYEDFYKDSKRPEEYRSTCKSCYLKKYKYTVSEKGRENWRRYKRSKKGIITCLLNNAKDRAKRNNLPYELDYEWLEAKIDAGVCELSHLPFVHESRGAFKCSPYAPSIDKINPKDGYTKNNCRVICFCVNMALSDWGEDVLYNMCENLLKNRKIIKKSL